MLARSGKESLMKVFCSIAQTGENEQAVAARMEQICGIFRELDIPVYCLLYDERAKDVTEPRDFMAIALERLRSYDTLFVINTSSRRSEGMLMEIGAALERGMKIVYAQHVSSINTTYVPSLADQHFIWENEEELMVATRRLFDEMRHDRQSELRENNA